MSRIIGKNRGIRNASYKSIINVEWFHKHNLNKSGSWINSEYEIVLLMGDTLVGRSTAVSLTQAYYNFNYLVFIGQSTNKSQTIHNFGDVACFNILSLLEFEMWIQISKTFGYVVAVPGNTATDGGSPYIRPIGINGNKSYTGAYWSAGFLQSINTYGIGWGDNYIRIYGIRKK